MSENEKRNCVVVGAGPAGLTAAYELSKLSIPAVVFERDTLVGGIAQTGSFRGYRFDIGGHRFFTKVDFVHDLWVEILGEDFLVRPRLSRIYYDGKFFDYPLKPLNALKGLGPIEAVRIGLSYLRARAFPEPEERNFEQWITNRFGRRLFEIFFQSYTEKVWGIPCSEIGADWAAQRIKQLDLVSAVKNAVLGARKGPVIDSLIERFHYPRLGPGMMWTRCAEILESRGIPTHLETDVRAIHHRDGRVTGVTVRDASGAERTVEATDLISSMPVRELVRALDPAPPDDVLEAGNELRYRDFVTVLLVYDEPELFPDNWIYIHSPEVHLGRIQNFKNWSPEMVPDPSTTALGLEYFVQENDEIWSMPDDELIRLAVDECARIDIADAAKFVDGAVVRIPKAYPTYDDRYQGALARIRDYLEGIENIQLIGRNGQHRYNNQDHSMVTGVYAAQNVAGASHDVWGVNVEDEYHEEGKPEVQDRATPGRVEQAPFEELLRTAFARYDPIALGGALGLTLGLGLFLATAVLVVKGGETVGPTLSLLGNYLPAYSVTWAGAFLGLIEGAALGGVVGALLAGLINLVVELHARRFVAQAAARAAFDTVSGDVP